jgi:hypothetical protein
VKKAIHRQVLTKALGDWGTAGFATSLKRELLALGPATMPLHLGTTQGGIVDESSLDATVLGFEEEQGTIKARVGFFFTEIVGGCSCGDDPLASQAYCELLVLIDRATGETEIRAIAA